MLESILQIFPRMVNVVKESPIASLLTVLLIIGIIAAIQSYNNNTLLYQLTDNPARSSAHFQAALEVNNQITDELDIMRDELKADRIEIRQFHNGKHDLTGLPFTYVATTYISLAEGIEAGADVQESKPISGLTRTLSDMWGKDIIRPICIAKNVQTTEDAIYKQYLRGYGIHRYYLCPLVNLKKYPIGYISISYFDNTLPKDITEEIVMERNRRTSMIISGYIQQIDPPEKENSLLSWFY